MTDTKKTGGAAAKSMRDKATEAATGASEPRDDAEGGGSGDATAAELAALKRAEAAEMELELYGGDVGVIVALLAELPPVSEVENERPLETTARVLNALGSKVTRLEGELAARGTELDNVRDELRETKDKLEAATAKAAKADREKLAAQRRKPKSTSRRKLARLKEVDRDEIDVAMIEAAVDHPFEVAFSDGRNEVIELEPIEAHAAAFRRARGGKIMLNDPILVRASADGIRIAGLALLNASGKQIGWLELDTPVVMSAGQERRFDNVVF